MNDRTRTWIRRWLPVITFLLMGALTLAQWWLSTHPG